MASVRLRTFCQARSGDKGDSVNIALFAPTDTLYEVITREVSVDRVKRHFAGLVEGDVRRYALPNVHALNFVCDQALDGGGSASMRMDNLGKLFGSHLLRMEIDVDDRLLAEAGVGGSMG